MAIEATDFIKWMWTIPAAWIGSMEFRLRNKVGRDTCDAIHSAALAKIDDVKKHMDQRFDDHKDFYKQQIDRVIREVKKNNNGG
jgi:hypothetical protein